MSARPAELADLASVRACVEAAFSPFIAEIGRRPAPMDADLLAMIAAGEVWITGNGTAMMALRPVEGAMLLDILAVAPAAQGQGLGRLMVAQCETLARAAGLPAVELYTNAAMTGAQRLYAGLGYTEVARGPHEGFARVFYRKAL